jgi:formylglycine-generating enzyme required for sulfatase activity
MEFVPFGHERWEMSRTEVPERAWNTFLREQKGMSIRSSGRVDYPMTLGDESPDLLREFVQWFGERSADGYVYSIPTVERWITAFSGTCDAARAADFARAWFRGDRVASTSTRFNPSPRQRYGFNRLLPVGSRPENRTPTGLLDMVANVQEIVLEGEVPKVIGGSNRDASTSVLEANCLAPRPYDTNTRDFQGAFTGFRLCRRPALAGGGD